MNNDINNIWENYQQKNIDDLIREQFEQDVINTLPYVEDQLIQEGIMSNIGNAVSTGIDKAKELGSKALGAAKNIGGKVAGAVSDKLVQPLLSKAWSFLQQNAPDVAQRISAAVAAGDANALQAEIQKGGGDKLKIKSRVSQINRQLFKRRCSENI